MLYQIKEWFRQMFAYPPLNLEEVDYDKYWKDKRGKNIGAISDWQELRADFIALKVVEPSHFVDIGCGDGSILNFLKEKGLVSKGVGVDMSEFALDKVRDFGFETLNKDIRDRKFVDEMPEADFILMLEILEHIEHSEAMLKGAYNMAKKGVFFSFPNTGFFVHRFRLFFGRFPLQWRLSPGEHLRFWTKRDLVWWLKELGFDNYEIFYYKGMPVLNKIWPSMFAAGFVIFLVKK